MPKIITVHGFMTMPLILAQLDHSSTLIINIARQNIHIAIVKR